MTASPQTLWREAGHDLRFKLALNAICRPVRELFAGDIEVQTLSFAGLLTLEREMECEDVAWLGQDWVRRVS